MSTPAAFVPPSSRQHTASPESQHGYDAFPQRPVRVKVLYTFDREHKNTHLTRLRMPLNVPVARIDNSTQIGIVDLKTCIEAVLSASPEIRNKSAMDYTMYVNDYSEDGSPLVGHGSLSNFMGSNGSLPSTPHDFGTSGSVKVNGRICSSMMGTFLEIKLRLAPLDDNAERINGDIWPPIQAHNQHGGCLPPTAGFQKQLDMDAMHHAYPESAEPLSNQSAMAGFDQDCFGWPQPGFDSTFSTMSRSPSVANFSVEPLQQPSAQDMSRPVSRVSRVSESFDATGQLDMELPTEEELLESRARKRVRVTPADWHGRSSFGSTGDSLRVAASTAASIRLHRPVPRNPAAARIDSIEPPPREPTPRPGSLSAQGSRQNTFSSALRHESSTESRVSAEDSPPPRPFSSRGQDDCESITRDSPVDFPSSPPMFLAACEAEPAQSSPLPLYNEVQTPDLNDSGFMSDVVQASDNPHPAVRQLAQPRRKEPFFLPPRQPSLEELKEQWRSKEKEKQASATSPASAPPSQIKAPGAKKSAPNPGTAKTATKKDSRLNDAGSKSVANKVAHPTEQPPKAAAASISRPCTPVEQRVPQNRNLKQPTRSQSFSGSTWKPKPGDVIYEPGATGIPQPRSGSGAKRRKEIEDRLAICVANGEMPPYCHNCGVVRTPTWRRAYALTVDGDPAEVTLNAEEEDGIVSREVAETVDGKVVKFRVFKKAVTAAEKDLYETFTLCNPCGLWFDKKNTMRPESKWNVNPSTRNRKPKNGATEIYSDAPVIYTDPVEMGDSQPPAAARIPPKQPQQARKSPQQEEQRKQQQTQKRPSETIELTDEPSPKRQRESVESDIHCSTPAPTRRLLFPTPKKQTGRSQVFEDSEESAQPQSAETMMTSPRIRRDATPVDKENTPPTNKSAFTTPTKSISSSVVKDLFGTPRSGQSCLAPLTPFTDKVNALLSEGDFPSFDTPGRHVFEPSSDFDALLTSPSTGSRGAGSRVDSSKILEDLWGERVEWDV